MAESITARVARLVSGGVNMLVDSLESASPDIVLDEAVREIASAIDDVRAELGQATSRRHLAGRRLNEARARHEDLAEKLAVAIREGRDDLAEAAIAQQLDIEAQIPVLEQAIAEAGAHEKELEGYISALQGKRREMQDEIREYRSRRDRSGGTGGPDDGPVSGAKVDDAVRRAEGAYERVLEAATGLPPGQGSSAETAAKVAELEKLSRANRVRERLAAAKAALDAD